MTPYNACHEIPNLLNQIADTTYFGNSLQNAIGLYNTSYTWNDNRTINEVRRADTNLPYEYDFKIGADASSVMITRLLEDQVRMPYFRSVYDIGSDRATHIGPLQYHSTVNSWRLWTNNAAQQIQ